MSEGYSCTFPDCGKVFSRAYELKKHKVIHEDPSRVFHCPRCDFITLQKKNLGIHIATHTGEKRLQCPDMVTLQVSPESLPRVERCEYRTNDPAALTKHRKRVHGYIPPPNRSRPQKAAPRKPYQKKDGKASRRSQSPQLSYGARDTTSDARYTSNSSESSKDSSPFSRHGHTRSTGSDTSDLSGCDSSPFPWTEDMRGQSMDLNTSEMSAPFLFQGPVDAYGRSIPSPSDIFSVATFMSPYEKSEQHDLYDASLHAQWMAKYEQSYSGFDETGLKYQPEPPQANLPPLLGSDLPTDRVGCLCPEWMVEAGIEGWDRSVLEAQ